MRWVGAGAVRDREGMSQFPAGLVTGREGKGGGGEIVIICILPSVEKRWTIPAGVTMSSGEGWGRGGGSECLAVKQIWSR